MASLTGPISDSQLAVLRWMADGSPPGVMPGHTYKIVAVALQSRRLVEISKKGGHWKATVTSAGRHYLTHGIYPDGHWSRAQQAGTRRTETRTAAAPTRDRSEHPAAAASEWAGADSVAKSPAPGPTRDPGSILVERVISAGGVLSVDERADRTNYQGLISGPRRPPNLPAGKCLRSRRVGRWPSGRLEIYFDNDHWALVHERPVPVPDRVQSYQVAVAAYRQDIDRHEVSPGALGRASRMLQALACEAERRGYLFAHPHQQQHQYTSDYRSSLKDGQFQISIGEHSYQLRIREEPGRGGGPTPHYSSSGYARLPRWQAAKTTLFVPTGKLRITVEHGYSRDGRTAEFRDTKTRPLEARLPGVLREVEVRALEDTAKRQEQQRQDDEKRRSWERAVETAKRDLREAHRAEVLKHQLERWSTARELDAYLADMRTAINRLTGDDKIAADAWLAWATQYRDTIDPLGTPLGMPADPEPTPKALQPFLNGLSPLGPA